MATIPFDTLKMAEEMEAAGFTHAQARTQARILSEIASADRSTMATKLDIADVKLEIEKVRSELVKWVVTVGILQTAIVSALVLKIAS